MTAGKTPAATIRPYTSSNRLVPRLAKGGRGMASAAQSKDPRAASWETRCRLEQGARNPEGATARNGELVKRLMALRPGGALTLIGVGQAQLGELLSQAPSLRRMLRLDLIGV